MWEEPPISGTNGSGIVFFTGCNLRCVFCQNYKISQEHIGKEISVPQLAELFFQLAEQGVHNINLVTPTHIIPQIATAIKIAKNSGLKLPFVYNTNGYENVQSLQLLDGLIDIYLPDIKYYDDEVALLYSNAKNYFDIAAKAVLEMNRQVGASRIAEDGMMYRGLIIRHLVLPGLRKDSMRILDWVAEHLPDAYVSLMAQYMPAHRAQEFQELNRRVTTFEYRSVVEYFFKIGLTNGFMQNRSAAVAEYIPDFS